MNCFKHKEVSAVGICSHCGKGLCNECVNETASLRFVCSKGCEEAADKNDMMADYIIKQTKKAYSIGAFVYYGLGISFLFTALFYYIFTPWALSFGIIALTAPIGLLSIYLGFKYKKAEKKG